MPFDLSTKPATVIASARTVLRAGRSPVRLFDAAADELVMEVSSDVRIR